MKGFVENPHVHDLVPESVKKIFITVSFFILQKKRKTEKKKKNFYPVPPPNYVRQNSVWLFAVYQTGNSINTAVLG